MQHLEGNALDIDRGLVVHQTNCIGIMGGGIALQVAQRWPNVYRDYAWLCNQVRHNPKLLLGHVQYVPANSRVTVANLFGQVFPGSGLMTDYTAFTDGVRSIARAMAGYTHEVYFPYKIGCGLAGGDWKVVYQIIEAHCPNANIVELPMNVRWTGR